MMWYFRKEICQVISSNIPFEKIYFIEKNTAFFTEIKFYLNQIVNSLYS